MICGVSGEAVAEVLLRHPPTATCCHGEAHTGLGGWRLTASWCISEKLMKVILNWIQR